MSFLDDIGRLAVGRVTFPLMNALYNRRNILGTYRNLMRSEQLPEEALRTLQLRKLKEVVAYAAQWAPFYARRFKDIGLEPGDIRSFEDLERIPPLSRQDVIDHHREMVDSRHASAVEAAVRSKRGPGEPIPFALFRKHSLVRNTSSGSTGAPTVFFEDGSITAANWANELRLRRWFGIEPGAREARMARIATDYMPRARVVLLRKLLWGQLLLPGVNLAEADYAFCLEQIRLFRPRVLWGFTSALAGLAEFMLASNNTLGKDGPRLLITWAAPLHDGERAVLSEAFACPVTNVYGAREVGHLGARCPEGSLHLNDESAWIETEKGVGESPQSNNGEILVTTLTRTPMPFIRYRMGDLGAISSRACSCGRSLRVMDSFLGRTGEVFTTKSGRMISPNFWCRTFMDPQLNRCVKRFQVVYTRERNLRIKLVKAGGYTPETEAYLRRFLERNFEPTTHIDFEYPACIEPLVSGKYQMVVNESNAGS